MGGVGGIPPSEIEAELRRWRITDEDEQEEFWFLLRVLDSEYLKIGNEEREHKAKQTT
jgi:hypothetical protein